MPRNLDWDKCPHILILDSPGLLIDHELVRPIFSQFDDIIKSLAGTELCGCSDHHGGANQQFRLEGQHLVCNHYGAELVLDIAGGSKKPGTKVILWTNEHTQKNQMWRLDYEDDY